jgi:glutaredoxin
MLIEVYTHTGCTLCTLTKRFLEGKKLTYTERVVDVDVPVQEILQQYPTANSVPMVIVDGEWIGGFNELVTKIGDAVHG